MLFMKNDSSADIYEWLISKFISHLPLRIEFLSIDHMSVKSKLLLTTT